MDKVQSGPLKEEFRAGDHGAASRYGSSSQPAAANRVSLREGTRAAAAPAPKAPAGSAGHTNKITRWDFGRRYAHMESPVTHYCGTEALRSFYGAGAMGTCGAVPITEIGRRHPPTTSRLEFHRHQCLTLG